MVPSTPVTSMNLTKLCQCGLIVGCLCAPVAHNVESHTPIARREEAGPPPDDLHEEATAADPIASGISQAPTALIAARAGVIIGYSSAVASGRYSCQRPTECRCPTLSA